MVRSIWVKIFSLIILGIFANSFGQFVPDGIDSGLIPPRPDRFGPRRPDRRQRRPNQRPRRPTSNLDFDVMNG